MCQDFNHFSGFLLTFVLAKLATSSISRVLSKSNPTWPGVDGFQISLRPWILEESSLSIGWVNLFTPTVAKSSRTILVQNTSEQSIAIK